MASTPESLTPDHRAIEAALDCLSNAPGAVDWDAFQRVHALCAAHYAREEAFLSKLEAPLAAKLRRQHEEALEIAAHLAADPASPDVPYLLRRFRAIVQHNIIEEERDVFPLYANQ